MGKYNNCFLCLGFDLIIQLCGKSYCTHNPKRILPKPLLRVSNTTDHAILDILHPTENINQTFFGIICHRIDGKIAPAQILLQVGGESHILRMPAICIFSVDPIGGYFKSFLAQHNRNRTMLDSCINSTPEQPFNFHRVSICRNIPVSRYPLQNGISDTAAYHICFMPCLMQGRQNHSCFLRNFNMNIFISAHFFTHSTYHNAKKQMCEEIPLSYQALYFKCRAAKIFFSLFPTVYNPFRYHLAIFCICSC